MMMHTHLPMFHQVEGTYVDEDVSFKNLKYLIYKIISYASDNFYSNVKYTLNLFPFKEPFTNKIFV